MQSSDHRRTTAVSPAAATAEHDPNAAREAALAVVAWWGAVSVALSPVLGSRGVGALYQRTVHLAARLHPFLAGVDATAVDIDLVALQALLDQQTEPTITAARNTLTTTLISLLEGLVGTSLTARLLHDVQAPTTGGTPAQDTTS